jgi:Mor family transcriptional regulator
MGRSVKRYQNAAKLLPKALLQELQQYAAGKMLYVPYPITRREFNRLKVLDLRAQGYSLNQIAFRMGMTRQGVCRILRQDRQRALAIMNMLYHGE